MSKHLGEVYEIHDPHWTKLKDTYPESEVYYLPDYESDRAWYVTRLSETKYSYVYFGDGTLVKSSDTTPERWNCLLKMSYLVVNNGALPYAHRN